MKVLVTGATGLLGWHIVEELQKRKYDVRVLVRPESNTSALAGTGVEIIEGQLTDKKDVFRAVEGCAYVIHSAAYAYHKPTRLDVFFNINVESTRFICEASREARVSRLVYISTSNCFANGTKSKPGDETNSFQPWMKRSGYAFSKHLAQSLVLDAAAGELDAVVVNPTFIIGKDIKPGAGKIFSYILNRKIAFHPVGGKNFVDASAVGRGVALAMEKGRRGECYLLAGENLSYRQFFKLVLSESGQKSWLIPVPCILLKLAGWIGDFSEQVLNRPVELTHVNAKILCQGNYYTPAKAVNELGFKIIPARESISKTLRWFRENHGW